VVVVALLVEGQPDARLLGAVHGHVGLLQQRLDTGAVVGEEPIPMLAAAFLAELRTRFVR